MNPNVAVETRSGERKWLHLALSQRKRIFRLAITGFLLLYAAVTLFPFYVLFVRTFVGTRDAVTLHLWLPPMEELNMEQEIGNLAVFYNLDLRKLKEELGISPTTYIPPRISLRQISENYDVPLSQIKAYFAGFSRYNGWRTFFTSTKLWPSIIRTLLITTVSLLGINFLSICTGYGLAGLRRKDQMFIYNLYLLQMVIPPMLIILPQFMIIQWLTGLFPNATAPGSERFVSQLVAVILINVKGGALSTMVFTSYISTIPRELEESAEIDGASRLQYLYHVLLPLLKVPIASLTVIMLPLFWNQFLEPYVYLDPANTTLLPLIQSFTGQYTTNFQVTYTGILVSILPLAVVYILFRHWFIQGVMSGAIKG